MNLATHTAQQIREAFFGRNWTASSFKDHLGDVSWEQAITEIPTFNTIAGLVYHVNYYMEAILIVFHEGKLESSDRYSFDLGAGGRIDCRLLSIWISLAY